MVLKKKRQPECSGFISPQYPGNAKPPVVINDRFSLFIVEVIGEKEIGRKLLTELFLTVTVNTTFSP